MDRRRLDAARRGRARPPRERDGRGERQRHDVEFSNDNGTTWTYTPAAGAGGCDAAVTNVRMNPKGTFAIDSGSPDPSFNLRFRICVK